MSEEQEIPSSYKDRYRLIKLGLLPKEAVKKSPKPLKRVSAKKKTENALEKEARGGGDTFKEKWFKARRREMIGVCQCGCSEKSSKADDANFRSSICHIFPKAIFESVQYHKLNWVERKFWATATSSACHTNMDNQSMNKWPMFADWNDIKERFHQLAPLLTDKERKTKFYTHLEKLVYGN